MNFERALQLIAELEIADGELLVSDIGPQGAALELEIAHEPTASVLHKHALLVVAGHAGRDELDVLQGRRLGNLPVDGSNVLVQGRVGDVEDEVADLAQKVALTIVSYGSAAP